MKNSGVSSIVLKRRIFRVGDSPLRFDGTFSDRTNYLKMGCAFGIENDSTMMLHRQQLVLQAPAATCSVDSTSHESFTESLSDRSIPYASEYRNSANCAQDCDLTLRESHINDSHTSNAEVGINQPVPWRYQQWIHKFKNKPTTNNKRRRLRQ